jgi:predicted transcriptional regulator
MLSEYKKFRISLIILSTTFQKFAHENGFSQPSVSNFLKGKLKSARIQEAIDRANVLAFEILKKKFSNPKYLKNIIYRKELS